jgi:hypothetical protein
MSCFEIKNRDRQAAFKIITTMFSHRRNPDASIILRLLRDCVWDKDWTMGAVVMANNLYKAARAQGWVQMRGEFIVGVLALYGTGLIRRLMKDCEIDQKTRIYFNRMVRFDEPSRKWVLDESMKTENGVIKYWREVNELPGYPKFASSLSAKEHDSDSAIRNLTPEINESIGSSHDLEKLLGILVDGCDHPSSEQFKATLDPTRDFKNYTKEIGGAQIATKRIGVYSLSHTLFVHLLLIHCDTHGFVEGRRVVMRDYQRWRDWDVGFENRLRGKIFY